MINYLLGLLIITVLFHFLFFQRRAKVICPFAPWTSRLESQGLRSYNLRKNRWRLCLMINYLLGC